MVNFGYPYNDLVICKDSTDYLAFSVTYLGGEVRVAIVHAIFTQNLDPGELPRDWSLANVAPIFKKGNRVLAENYRPVSL